MRPLYLVHHARHNAAKSVGRLFLLDFIRIAIYFLEN